MGRWEDSNYTEGYEGDYYIITDAVDEALGKFIIEDDIAEPAIYAETIERVGKFVAAVDAAVNKHIEDTTHCPLCWAHDGRHFEGCPILLLPELIDEDALEEVDEALGQLHAALLTDERSK